MPHSNTSGLTSESDEVNSLSERKMNPIVI